MKRIYAASLCPALLIILAACQSIPQQTADIESAQAKARPDAEQIAPSNQRTRPNPGKLIHVLVALCDNQYQGIVPVPARIGNGDDPANNLYWGAAYGVKSFFKRASDWRQVSAMLNPKPEVLERLVFKHQTKEVYLVADAYRGREIKKCTMDFLEFAAGRSSETITVNPNSFASQAGGSADLIAYVGHDGLMDFALAGYPQKSDERRRDAIVLACASKRYFAQPLGLTGAHPLLWTTGLMAPESYVLKAAIDGWILNESGEEIRKRAAQSYHQYQRCGLKAAMHLFSSGW